MITKEEYVARYKRWLSQPREIPIITIDEYKTLVERSTFKCPVNIDRRDCIGHECPTRLDDAWNDYYWECVESRKASNILYSIMKGRTMIHHDENQGWEVPV